MTLTSDIENNFSKKLKLKPRIRSYIQRVLQENLNSHTLQSSKWQLIGKSQWCCSAEYGRPLHVLTNNWTRGKQPANTPPLQSTTPDLHPVSIHQMASPERTSDCSLLLIYRPRNDERLSWPIWPTCSGRFTHITGHLAYAGRAQNRESPLAKDRRSTTLPRHQHYWTGNQNLIYLVWNASDLTIDPYVTHTNMWRIYDRWNKVECLTQCACMSMECVLPPGRDNKQHAGVVSADGPCVCLHRGGDEEWATVADHLFAHHCHLLLISLRCHPPPLEGVTRTFFTCPTSFLHYSL